MSIRIAMKRLEPLRMKDALQYDPIQDEWHSSLLFFTPPMLLVVLVHPSCRLMYVRQSLVIFPYFVPSFFPLMVNIMHPLSHLACSTRVLSSIFRASEQSFFTVESPVHL